MAIIDVVKTISKLVEQESLENIDLANSFPDAKVAIARNTELVISY